MVSTQDRDFLFTVRTDIELSLAVVSVKGIQTDREKQMTTKQTGYRMHVFRQLLRPGTRSFQFKGRHSIGNKGNFESGQNKI